MRWRPTIYMGTWGGVEIRLDVLLVLLIGLLFFTSLNNANVKGAPAGEVWSAIAHLVLLVALVGCMFLHEIGHALMCKLRGHEPRMILLSFVGLTFFKASKAKPSDEFWIALAGPMVNLLIAVATFPFVIVLITDPRQPQLAFTQASMASLVGFMSWLCILNFLVALGNLTPGWPADGSRAVRGWLAKKYGYAAGTVRAVAISHGFWLCLAGFSVIIMTIAPLMKVLVGNTPTQSRVSMIVMYNVVFLVMAAVGLYYGHAEKRRVARLGAERAAAVVGPPPEFMPKGRSTDGGTKVVDVEATVDGKEQEPGAPATGKEPGKIDELKAKAAETLSTGKTMYKVAKATGKGGGWFAKQGFKMLGAMFAGDKKKDAPKEEPKT